MEGFGHCDRKGHQSRWVSSKGTSCSKWVFINLCICFYFYNHVFSYNVFGFIFGMYTCKANDNMNFVSLRIWICIETMLNQSGFLFFWSYILLLYSWSKCQAGCLRIWDFYFFGNGISIFIIIFIYNLCSFFLFIVGIFSATSVSRPRADVAYCIHALARRLAKTKNWIVILLLLCIHPCSSFFLFAYYFCFLNCLFLEQILSNWEVWIFV